LVLVVVSSGWTMQPALKMWSGAAAAWNVASQSARRLDLIAHYIVGAIWLWGVPDDIVHDDHRSVSAYIAVSPNYGHLLFASMMLSTALAGMRMGVHVFMTRPKPSQHCPVGSVVTKPSSSSSPSSSPSLESNTSNSSCCGIPEYSGLVVVHEWRSYAALIAPFIGSCFGLALYIVPVCVQPWHNVATCGTFVCGTLVVITHRHRVRPSRATLIVWGLNLLALIWEACVGKVSINFFVISELVGFFSYRHFLVQSYVQTRLRLPLLSAITALVAGATVMKRMNDALGGEACLDNRAQWFS